MIEFRARSINTTQTMIHEPITVTHVVVGNRNLPLVESSEFEEQQSRGEHARRCHGRAVASHRGVGKIAVTPAWQKLKSRSCHPVIVAMSIPGILNTLVLIK